MGASDGREVLFASGRSDETTCSDGALSIGETEFTLASASGWAEGDAVFCSESDGSEVEYLGLVQSVDGSVVTVEHGLVAAKGSSAKFWTATTAVEFPWDITGAPRVESDDGIEQSETLDGLVHRYQVRDPSVVLVVNYSKLWTENRREVRDFYRDTVLYGVDDFVVAFWNYEEEAAAVWRVRVVGEWDTFVEPSRGMSSLTLRLQRVAVGYTA